MKLSEVRIEPLGPRHGSGTPLLLDAMVRAARSEIASFALIVDAKDERAAGFYERESFSRLPGEPIRLVRRMDDVAALLGEAVSDALRRPGN